MIYTCAYCQRTYRRDDRKCNGDADALSHGHCPACHEIISADLYTATAQLRELAKNRGPACQREVWG